LNNLNIFFGLIMSVKKFNISFDPKNEHCVGSPIHNLIPLRIWHRANVVAICITLEEESFINLEKSYFQVLSARYVKREDKHSKMPTI
jgi:hypothetical protein